MGYEGNEAGDRANHILKGVHHRIGIGLLWRHWLRWRGRRRFGRGLRGVERIGSLLGFHGCFTPRRLPPLRGSLGAGRISLGDQDAGVRLA